MEDKAELLLHAGRPGRRATVALIEGGFGREVQCGVPALDGELLQQPDGMSCGQNAPSRVGHGNALTLKMVVTDSWAGRRETVVQRDRLMPSHSGDC